MEDISKLKIFLPYFKAADNIMNGVPVLHLDNIKRRCNAASNGSYGSLFGGYIRSSLMSFVINAENNILQGNSPKSAYSRCSNPEEFRARGIRGLEQFLDDYFSKIA